MATTYTLPDGSLLTKPAYADTADVNVINTSMQNLANNITTIYNAVNGKAIASNTNLDSLTTPGEYYCTSGTVAATLANSPVTSSGFVMLVMKRSSFTEQFIQCGATTYAHLYTRLITNDGAQPWFSHENTYCAKGNNSRNYMHCFGYVSGGTTSIILAVPLGAKSIKDGDTATITSMKGAIRGTSGYVDWFTDAHKSTEFVGTSGYTITTNRRNAGNILEVVITKSTELTNVTNNTPVEGYFTTFAFNLS